ncbi:hypothetical protein EKN38_25285 [Enterobacter sp. WCHEn045836]|uniref:hypothetical protein n=1 Tax=Enterobacter sp. WCHEn045836 TaxID=2497434 RepID=UPI000F82EDDE|nr:hypothetical protein [Enterobacter sp. WCHEn045836]RTP93713.1 hypothetical protein EKN38_25285 [Enterobacter sp. WCHEn045836]
MTLEWQIIKPERIEALSSGYLSHGYRQDETILSCLRYHPSLCESQFDIISAYRPTDGKFHLSMLTASTCISQTGIIYAGLLNELDEKAGEVYVIDFMMKFQNPVNEKSFVIDARMTELKKSRKGIIYRMQGNVQTNAFHYDVTFLFPTHGN